MRAAQFTFITCEDAITVEQLRKPERNIDHEGRIAELCREVRFGENRDGGLVRDGCRFSRGLDDVGVRGLLGGY